MKQFEKFSVCSLFCVTAFSSSLLPVFSGELPSKGPSTASLLNGTYSLPEFMDKPIRLRKGRAEGTGSEFPYGWECRLEKSALGDLNSDGNPDAAVVLGFNGGGSGYFVRLIAMLNKNGQLKQSAIRELGDRVGVTGMRIQNQALTLVMNDHSIEDSNADLSLERTLVLKLNAGKWKLVSEKAKKRAVAP